jgi:hypothetical protein
MIVNPLKLSLLTVLISTVYALQQGEETATLKTKTSSLTGKFNPASHSLEDIKELRARSSYRSNVGHNLHSCPAVEIPHCALCPSLPRVGPWFRLLSFSSPRRSLHCNSKYHFRPAGLLRLVELGPVKPIWSLRSSLHCYAHLQPHQ